MKATVCEAYWLTAWTQPREKPLLMQGDAGDVTSAYGAIKDIYPITKLSESHRRLVSLFEQSAKPAIDPNPFPASRTQLLD